MADGERKSSADLIREANQRLRGTADSSGTPDATKEPGSAEAPRQTSQEMADRSQDRSAEEPLGIQVEPVEDRSGPWTSERWIRWIVAAMIFGGIYLFSTFGDADRDGTGEIVGAGDLDVMSLRVGDCFDDPEDFEEVVFDVAAVPCTEPHHNEVFAVQSLASAFPGDVFPGQDRLWEYSYDICSGSPFDSYVGTRFLDSSLDVFAFTPTSESWDEGDREFVCALYRLDFGRLTGTARDSGL